MNTDRRAFLHLGLAAGAVLASHHVGWSSQAAIDERKNASPGKKNILILGGTSFLGPAIVNAARERGHTLTLFNRGKTRPGLFPEIEKLQGDRDPEKGEGIKALAGRKWDVVIDDCGYYPRMVKASAELLVPNVGQYIFISSISAYSKTDQDGMDEDTALATMSDPTVEEMGPGYANYGALKVLCEQAAQAVYKEHATIVRPGYIVGPEDPSDRFTYWPVRIDRGGDVLIPGDPSDPLQVIDVRDLGLWLVKLAENGTSGVFNAIGPSKKLAWGEVIDACKAAASKEPKLHWVATDALEKLGPLDFPIWIPPVGEYKGNHTISHARADQAGLTFRPIKETVVDTLAWFKTLPDERQSKLRAGPSAEQEAQALQKL